MPTESERFFNFSALDGVALAAERGRLHGDSMPAWVAGGIGPIIELALTAAIGHLPRPSAAPWLALGGLSGFAAAMNNDQTLWLQDDGSMGFVRTRTARPGYSTAWNSFRYAADRAAVASGFAKSDAAKFIGALTELHDNVDEHSGRPKSGLVGFQGRTGEFEMVVADRGVGVLESLRSGPDYRDLKDSGSALELALTEGVSRYGANSGRGLGYRPIFVGLANHNGCLRFRSGDHALVIDGRFSLMTARVAPKATMAGFLASVVVSA
ncbi:MAG: hypothetical protein FJZ01_16050 [Candidatus Sericytochromatia bacterium]|nr:hypothetical protein [Candidatus Tanganyikabacteria bacterium]